MSLLMNIKTPFKPLKLAVIKMGIVILYWCLFILGVFIVRSIASKEPLIALSYGFTFLILLIILGSEAYSLMVDATPKHIEQGRYYITEH